jgi:hypothetical protein
MRKIVGSVARRFSRLWWRPVPNANEVRMTASLPFLRSLKNRYRGRRGFVIGNGPSLRIEDLNCLQSEITIASNKIYLAFEKTSWRPSFHTVADPLVWDKIADVVDAQGLMPLVPSYLPSTSTRCHVVRDLGNAAEAFLAGAGIRCSDDLTAGWYGGYTVTFENLQLAFHLGLDPIIIIGCDHYYRGEKESDENQGPVRHGHVSNHFIENYRTAGEVVNPAPIRKMTISYELAACFARKTGRTVLNATRGGFLDAFSRCDFDSLFPVAGGPHTA